MAPPRRFLAVMLLLVAPCAGAASTTAALARRLRELGFVVGAHRGGVYRFAPDTMDQFLRAQRLGVDVIELDLRATRDGVPVVKHDAALGNGSYCAGTVDTTTYEALRHCPLKWWARRPPTFAAVLRRLGDRVILDAELKSPDVIRPAVDVVRRRDAYERVYFQTHDRAGYLAVRAYDPRVGLLFAPQSTDDLDWILGRRDPNLLVIELHPDLRTPEILDRIHRAGMLISENAWHFGRSLLNPREFLWADCDDVYAHGIDIAISENPWSCLRERDALQRAAGTSTPAPRVASPFG